MIQPFRAQEHIYRLTNWINTTFQAKYLSLRLLLSFTVIGLAFAVVADVPESSSAFPLARVVMIAAAISIVFLPIRYSVPLLMLMFITGRDIDTETTASIWNLSVGFANPSWFVFLLIAAQLYKLRKSLRFPLFLKVSIAFFAVVPLVTTIIYGQLTETGALTETIVDLKLPMMLLGMYMLVSAFIRLNPTHGIIVLSVIVAGLFARHLVDLIYLFIGYGPTFEGKIDGTLRVSLDSVKSGIVFLVIVGVFLVSILPQKAGWGFLIAVPAVMLTVAYGTRMIWVEFFITIPIILFMVKGRQIPLAVVSIMIVILAGSGALFLVNSSTADFALGRAQKAVEGEPAETSTTDADYNFLSRVDPIRYAEILNVLDTAGERKSWIFGSGYGAYYTDDAVKFPTNLATAFSDENFETGHFYRAHNYVIHFFHKYGLIGLTLISSFWILPAYVLIRRFRQTKEAPSLELLLTGALMAFMLTAMIETTWSGKGYALNGSLIALMTYYVMSALSISSDLNWIRRWLS